MVNRRSARISELPVEAATPICLGLVGVGKIARDQHLPAIAANASFRLAAAASRHGSVPDLANFPTIERMIADGPTLTAVSLCAPPSVRAAMAREAIEAGLHVMLEKPPGINVSEVADLSARAARRGTSLFAGWHSREAAAVAHARAWLARRQVTAARIRWLEDVRVWHPGQEWIWEAGGFGVFDPGINAISIATHILPEALVLTAANLWVPANRDTPMRAELRLQHGNAAVDAQFSFCHMGVPTWDIEVDTTDGVLLLADGGSRLDINGAAVAVPASTEYANLYRRFAALIQTASSEVDVSPLQLIADACLCGRRIEIEPFHY